MTQKINIFIQLHLQQQLQKDSNLLKIRQRSRYLVAHGRNSDPNHDGYATNFSNAEQSLMSSRGFYLTAETYRGKYGRSLRLDGLSKTNSQARRRAVVIHSAGYVHSSRIKIGRSFGCPALDFKYAQDIIHKIKKGALIYAE